MHYYGEPQVTDDSPPPSEPDGDWDDDDGPDGDVYHYHNCNFYNGDGPFLEKGAVAEIMSGLVVLAVVVCITLVALALLGK